jgi:hypothetical protein
MKLTVTSRGHLRKVVRRMGNHCRSRSDALWLLGLPHHTSLRWTVNERELLARFVQGQVRFWVDGERVPSTRLAELLGVGADPQTGPESGAGSLPGG